jgi:hypothetical protein
LKILWLVYDRTLALVDVKCGSPEELDGAIKSRLQREGGLGVRVSCESPGGRCTAEVIAWSGAPRGFVTRSYSVDGLELVYRSVEKCADPAAQLPAILSDIYRRGSLIYVEALKPISKLLGG